MNAISVGVCWCDDVPFAFTVAIFVYTKTNWPVIVSNEHRMRIFPWVDVDVDAEHSCFNIFITLQSTDFQ